MAEIITEQINDFPAGNVESLHQQKHDVKVPGAVERLLTDFDTNLNEQQFQPTSQLKEPQKPLPATVKKAQEGGESEKGVAADVGTQVAGGVRDATVSVVNGINAIAEWMDDHLPGFGKELDPGARVISEDEEGKLIEETVAQRRKRLKLDDIPVPDDIFPKIDQPETVAGALTRGITQFMVGFLPALRALKGFKAVGVVQKAAKAQAAVAVADFTVFDAQAERVSNLVEEFPQLSNPVTAYLAADENDTEIEGRLKNVLEGQGLDAMVAGAFIGSLKSIRAVRKLKNAPQDALKEAKIETPTATRTVGKKTVKKVKDSIVPVENLPEKEALKITVPGEGKGKALNINLDKLNTTDDVKNIIKKTANTFEDQFQKARRGKISTAETERLADELGLSVEDLLSRQTGQAFNPEQALAARKIMVSSAGNIFELAKKVNGVDASDADRLALRRAIALHAAIQQQVSGLTAEAGRTLNQFKIPAGGDIERTAAIKNILESTGGRGTADDMAKAILETGNRIQKMNALVKKMSGANSFDMVVEGWINSILSGPRTHMTNMVSTGLNTVWQIPERALASVYSKVLPDSGDVSLKEVLHQFYGMNMGIMDGFRMARESFLAEGAIDPLTKLELARPRAITAKNLSKTYLGKTADLTVKRLGMKTLEEGGYLAHFVDGIGSFIRMPGRFLSSEDAFFKAMNYRMELHAQAARQAISEGLNGREMRERMAELIANPSENIRTESLDRALVNTFTKPSTNKIVRAVKEATTKHPALKFFVPFINTPANIVREAFVRTPFAGLASEVRTDIKIGGAKRALALSRITLGSGAMVSAYSIAKAGFITGGAPKDPGLRDTWFQENQPYSLVFEQDGKKKFISYNRLEPFGMLLGTAADLAQILDMVGEKEAEEILGSGILAFSRNVTSKTWMRGVSDLVELFGTQGEQKIQRIGLNITSGFVPNFLNQTNQSFIDPVLRDPRGFKEGDFLARSMANMLDSAKTRIPGFSDDLPARRNLWGAPIEPRQGATDSLGEMTFNLLSPMYQKEVDGDAVNEMLLDNDIDIRMPRRSITLPGFERAVELTAEEYNRYVELAGKPAKEQLDQFIQSPKFEGLTDGPEGQKADAIRNIIRVFRIRAKAQLIEEFPDIEFRALESEL